MKLAYWRGDHGVEIRFSRKHPLWVWPISISIFAYRCVKLRLRKS
jgi:hypothetical protein